MINKVMEGLQRKGYLYQVNRIGEDYTTVEVYFTDFVAHFHITYNDKVMVTLFDNNNIMIDYRVYRKVGFAIRFMTLYRNELRQKKIEEILNK